MGPPMLACSPPDLERFDPRESESPRPTFLSKSQCGRSVLHTKVMERIKSLEFTAKTSGQRGRCVGTLCDEVANQWKAMATKRLAAAAQAEARSLAPVIVSDEGMTKIPSLSLLTKRRSLLIRLGVGIIIKY